MILHGFLLKVHGLGYLSILLAEAFSLKTQNNRNFHPRPTSQKSRQLVATGASLNHYACARCISASSHVTGNNASRHHHTLSTPPGMMTHSTSKFNRRPQQIPNQLFFVQGEFRISLSSEMSESFQIRDSEQDLHNSGSVERDKWLFNAQE